METQFGFGIRARNVNGALAVGSHLIRNEGKPTSSRGLEVLRAPGPVTTVYERPQERVLFSPVRDANPFFHLIDALWLLSGSNRVGLPAHFLKSIARFSDNGFKFHGAYGYRLRHAFGFDQIEMVCAMLKDKPDSRQAVMSIWNPSLDLAAQTLDMPCNDMLMLDVVDGALNLTVCNRSNDMVWGAYGANAVQFSVLQEYMAVCIGVKVGRYVQQSNNYHVYTDNAYWLKFQEDEACQQYVDYYEEGKVAPKPLAIDALDARWLFHDCCALDRAALEGRKLLAHDYGSTFFRDTVVPMIAAYETFKTKDFDAAIWQLNDVKALDWRVACTEWVQRRAAKVVA